jgi:hypothetical protein
MGMALFHGTISFFLTQYGLSEATVSDGKTSTHWGTSTVVFSICLHLATYKLFIESTYWNIINL